MQIRKPGPINLNEGGSTWQSEMTPRQLDIHSSPILAKKAEFVGVGERSTGLEMKSLGSRHSFPPVRRDIALLQGYLRAPLIHPEVTMAISTSRSSSR
jgi:hypothetical protein